MRLNIKNKKVDFPHVTMAVMIDYYKTIVIGNYISAVD